ncbi:MAG: HAD-IC family P-type ATPase [Chroococcidiopsidaceae cyanobacterium CP_BM_RX_35]|nr:HAD-IC family P-type ATPase [Chroococcidiopsidaceae cyanobacterium CP_BM_RX_35]
MAQIPFLKTQLLQVGGMDCGGCAKTLGASLQKLPGIKETQVSFATGRLKVTYNLQEVSETAISDRIAALGYTAHQISGVSASDTDDSCPNFLEEGQSVTKPTETTDLTGLKFWLKTRRGQSVILAGAGIVLGFLAQYLGLSVWILRAFYGIGIVGAGYPIALAGLFELRLRRADMNLLMTISVIGAVILGDWFEGALVVFLFSLGTTLQSFTFRRTHNAIRALIDLTPPTTTVKRGGQEVTVSVAAVQIGDILLLRPGQRVALDGVVISGYSAIDQSPITGESLPEDKAPGDRVFAGTLNQSGFLEVKVTHLARDTTVAKIIHLVTKGLFLLLGTFGFVGLALAVLADMGTSLLVTANGMRLFKTKTLED